MIYHAGKMLCFTILGVLLFVSSVNFQSFTFHRRSFKPRFKSQFCFNFLASSTKASTFRSSSASLLKQVKLSFLYKN